MTTLRRFSQAYHMWIHLFFGILAALIYHSLNPAQPLLKDILIGLSASLLPDIDHLFFFFLYGSKTDYSRQVKKFLKHAHFKQAIEFCKENHKHNTNIVSHNVVTMLLVLAVSSYLQFQGHHGFGVFALSWSYHYLFDMLEDLLFFGRLNPNWYLNFGAKLNQ